jgi:membrane protease subunit HflC
MLVLLAVLIAGGTLYHVDEMEQVVLIQFGEPVWGSTITTPGLHLKMPFIQTVRCFDKRVLERDGLPGQILTLDKRCIVLDITARWRIVNPLRLLQSVGDEGSAQSRLDDLINSAARRGQ